MAEQIDFYAASYENRCQTNRRNRNTIVNDRRPSSTTVDNGDQSNLIKSKSKQNIPPISPKGDTHKDAFNQFWQAYPKKRDKQRAEKAFAKAISKTDLETMLQALHTQKHSMDTLYPDALVLDMYNAGYKTYIDGKLYKLKKEARQCKK